MFPRNVFFEWNKQFETAVKYWQAGSIPSMEQGKEKKNNENVTQKLLYHIIWCASCQKFKPFRNENG